MSANTRVTITLSAQTADDLGVVSRTLGITRSALIAELLAMSSAELHAASLKSAYRPAHSDEPALRLRGDSAEVIQSRIGALWRSLHAD
jgi:hypothetical protein